MSYCDGDTGARKKRRRRATDEEQLGEEAGQQGEGKHFKLINLLYDIVASINLVLGLSMKFTCLFYYYVVSIGSNIFGN